MTIFVDLLGNHYLNGMYEYSPYDSDVQIADLLALFNSKFGNDRSVYSFLGGSKLAVRFPVAEESLSGTIGSVTVNTMPSGARFIINFSNEKQYINSRTAHKKQLAIPDTLSWNGHIYDGDFFYNIPNQVSNSYSGLISRWDKNTYSSEGQSTINLAQSNGSAVGCYGGLFDSVNQHIYWNTFYNGNYLGTVIRLPKNDFSQSAVQTINTGYNEGFLGIFQDNSYTYHAGSPNLVRVSKSNFSAGGVTARNIGIGRLSGGFTHNGYVYTGSYYGNNPAYITRVPDSNFTGGTIEAVNLTAVNSNLKGYYWYFTDGDYVYACPYYAGSSSVSWVCRVAINNFTASGVEYFDLRDVNPTLAGLYPGFVRGDHIWLCPSYNSTVTPNYPGLFVKISRTNFSASGSATISSGLALGFAQTEPVIEGDILLSSDRQLNLAELEAGVNYSSDYYGQQDTLLSEIGANTTRLLGGNIFSVLNSRCLVACKFNASLDAVDWFLYAGWLADSSLSSDNKLLQCTILTSGEKGRLQNKNVAGRVLYKTPDYTIDCVLSTSGADSTDVLCQDVSTGYFLGRLVNCIRLPSSALVGKVYKNTGVDPDTGQIETDKRAFWICAGSWGTEKIGMRVWTQNIV